MDNFKPLNLGSSKPLELRLLLSKWFVPVPLNTALPPPDCSLVLSEWLAPAAVVWLLLEACEETVPVKLGFLCPCTTLPSSQQVPVMIQSSEQGGVWGHFAKKHTASRCKYKVQTHYLMGWCLLALLVRKQNQNLLVLWRLELLLEYDECEVQPQHFWPRGYPRTILGRVGGPSLG